MINTDYDVNYNFKNLPVDIQNIIISKNNQYSFLDLDIIDFYCLFADKINISNKINEIEMIIDDEVSHYINKELNSNNIDIVNNYISDNIINMNDAKENLIELKRLGEFFKSCSFKVNERFCLSLLYNNDNLNLMLKNIVYDNLDEINCFYDINYLSEDYFCVLLIKNYCRLNNIISEKTVNSYNSINIYASDLNKPLLTPEREKELGLRVMQGDEQARKEFIESNLRLVVNIARKYIGRDLPFEDLIAEGNIGLIEAVDTFDATRGNRFSTYAVERIQRYIRKAIREKGRKIKIPYNMYDLIRKYRDAESLFMNQYGRIPNIEEMAKELNVSISKINDIKAAMSDALSINEIMCESDGELGDIIASPTSLDLIVDNRQLREAINEMFEICNLTDREKYILIMRYYCEKTLESIGETLGITWERTRQIEADALRKIRQNDYSKILISYTDNPDEAMNNLHNFRMKYSMSRLNRHKKLDNN